MTVPTRELPRWIDCKEGKFNLADIVSLSPPKPGHNYWVLALSGRILYLTEDEGLALNALLTPCVSLYDKKLTTHDDTDKSCTRDDLLLKLARQPSAVDTFFEYFRSLEVEPKIRSFQVTGRVNSSVNGSITNYSIDNITPVNYQLSLTLPDGCVFKVTNPELSECLLEGVALVQN